MRRVILQWCLLAIPTLACAQQWETVPSREGAVEFDRSSTISGKTGVQAWSRQTHATQILGPEEGFFYRRLIQLNEYQCGKQKYFPLQQMYFNDSGLLIKELRFSRGDEVERVIPGTPEARIYTNVCKNFQPPEKNNKKVAAKPASTPENQVKESMRGKNAMNGTTPEEAAANTQAVQAKAAENARQNAKKEVAVSEQKVNAAQGVSSGGILGFLNRLLPQASASSAQPSTPRSVRNLAEANTNASSRPTVVTVIPPTTTVPSAPVAPAAPRTTATPKASSSPQNAVAPKASSNIKAAPAARTETITKAEPKSNVRSTSKAAVTPKAQTNPSLSKQSKPITIAAITPQTLAKNTNNPTKRVQTQTPQEQKQPQTPARIPVPTVNLTERPTGNLPWLYNPDSPKGPSKWASLSPKNALCSKGLYQSPIDIRNAVLADMEQIQFNYRPMPLHITDTGTTIKVDVDAGVWLTWQGIRYDLLYYTFHQPSEIQINGQAADMSIQLVHRSVQGKVTVVAVPVKAGRENVMVRRVWNNLPLEMGVKITPPDVLINPAGLLPVAKGFYAFVGSLSTPPCTEGVLWLVMKTPVEMSPEQIADFKRLYKDNVRPIQPTRGRLVKVTRY